MTCDDATAVVAECEAQLLTHRSALEAGELTGRLGGRIPLSHQRLKRDWNGIERHYYAMPFQERYIWGVTAGILRNLYERIYAG